MARGSIEERKLNPELPVGVFPLTLITLEEDLRSGGSLELANLRERHDTRSLSLNWTH